MTPKEAVWMLDRAYQLGKDALGGDEEQGAMVAFDLSNQLAEEVTDTQVDEAINEWLNATSQRLWQVDFEEVETGTMYAGPPVNVRLYDLMAELRSQQA